MSRRRRAALLLGLALVLGALAASDVARRESALDAELAPLVELVVARGPLEAGQRLRARDLARRSVPARFAPAGAVGAAPELLVGRKLAVPVAEGGPLDYYFIYGPEPKQVLELRTDAGIEGAGSNHPAQAPLQDLRAELRGPGSFGLAIVVEPVLPEAFDLGEGPVARKGRVRVGAGLAGPGGTSLAVEHHRTSSRPATSAARS